MKMSMLVHSRGEGVKNGQNLVHVVVECPLIHFEIFLDLKCPLYVASAAVLLTET